MADVAALEPEGLDDLVDEIKKAELPSVAQRQHIVRAAKVRYREGARVLNVAPMTFLRWQKGLCEPRMRSDRIRYAAFLARLEELIR
jgi:hypothetical protein